MLSGFDEAFAAALQRINPIMSATCPIVIRTTFAQKRPPVVPYLFEDGSLAI
jgi:hypothetical protein